jgi:hypothetical protein
MGENEPIVSHGRGGQGNIGADSTQYVDAGIVREGPYGDQGDGAYSAGVSTALSHANQASCRTDEQILREMQ